MIDFRYLHATIMESFDLPRSTYTIDVRTTGVTNLGRTMRCTQVADRLFPDSKIVGRDVGDRRRYPKKKNPMIRTNLMLACFAIFLITGCTSKPETLVKGGYDESEMAAATERAINEVDAFISDLKTGRSKDYAVKAPIKDNGETEHFWLTEVTFDGAKFTGTIDNEPGMVSNVKMGQKWTLGKKEISDWMYMRDGKMYGNYTMRPLLVTMPKEQADQFRAMFATP